MKTFIFSSVVFFSLVIFMLLISGKMSPDNALNINVKKDPSSLPVPSQQFDEWQKQWEKQR